MEVMEAAPNAMIMVATDGLISHVNAQTERLFGYERRELVGQSIGILLPERFRASIGDFRPEFCAAPDTRAIGVDHDLFGLRRDGSEVPVEIGLSPMVTSNGKFIIASIIDVTERKKAQEIFQLIVEASPSSMIMVGTDGLITLVNTQTEKLFGYDRRDLLGKPIEILVPHRFRASHAVQREWFCDAPATLPKVAGRELLGLRRDGTQVPVEIGLNPIVTPEGQFVVASIVDITERKKAQEQLRRSLAEKTMLLKEVHHRVKNNLQVICSLLSMQIDCSDGCDVASRPLKDAHSRVLAMSLIHEQIYQSDTLADLDFGEYIKVLADRLFAAYCVNPLRVRLELDVETIHLPMPQAIPCGLILNELISNSLKHAFIDGREGAIRISLRKTGDDRAELAATDNGVGLPAGFRLEECRSLGLQVVRTLILQIRADLCVTAEAGTAFRFSWKLSDALS